MSNSTSLHKDTFTHQGVPSGGDETGCTATSNNISSDGACITSTTSADIAADSSPIAQSEQGTRSSVVSASPIPVVGPTVNAAAFANLDSNSDGEDNQTSHPNKFPVEIANDRGNVASAANNKEDNQSSRPNKSPFAIEYKERQPTRQSDLMMKPTVCDPMTSDPKSQMQQRSCYQKQLVRFCRCGKYRDCDRYEIHQSPECTWKACDHYIPDQRRNAATTTGVQPQYDPGNEDFLLDSSII